MISKEMIVDNLYPWSFPRGAENDFDYRLRLIVDLSRCIESYLENDNKVELRKVISEQYPGFNEMDLKKNINT